MDADEWCGDAKQSDETHTHYVDAAAARSPFSQTLLQGDVTMTNENGLSRTAKDVPTVEVTVKYLNALRKAAALHIDPETAEVEWWYAQTLDPYGDHPDLPEECWQVGREYFARIPGTDVWILFDDLPEVTHLMLWEKHKSKLAFPAGLSAITGPRLPS
jgi:hypothetical protein